MSFRQKDFVLEGFITFTFSFFQREKPDALPRSLKVFVMCVRCSQIPLKADMIFQLSLTPIFHSFLVPQSLVFTH